MRYKRRVLSFCSFISFIAASAQNNDISALNKKQFDKFWKVESESPDYRITFLNDTVEILSPKGLTLWRTEKMKGDIEIEYDACVMDQGKPGDRLSDLNCFWMASDAVYPDNIWKREKWRTGIFQNCYSLKLYYVGYGGNYNSTTRFRRYDGNQEGITQAASRPAILTEYTDQDHLLIPNKWYKIKIKNKGNRVEYYVDGERLVDYYDPEPLKEGWFGFRTTLSRTRITNFKYSSVSVDSEEAALHWVGDKPDIDTPVSFGVPFLQGEVKSSSILSLVGTDGNDISADCWPMAYWPDGSVKWSGVAAVIPAGTESLSVVKKIKATKKNKKNSSEKLSVNESPDYIKVNTGNMQAYIPRSGRNIIDSISYGNIRVGGAARLVASTADGFRSESVDDIKYKYYESTIEKAVVESKGDIKTVIKIEGRHKEKESDRTWLPFIVRLSFYYGSERISMAHTFVYDGNHETEFINSLGIRFEVPMRDELYNRHIAFACADGGVWSEPVKPLVGRRELSLKREKKSQTEAVADNADSFRRQQIDGKRIPPVDNFDSYNQNLINEWASWDQYRLSQLNSDAFTIRKRAGRDNPWIGTMGGTQAPGYVFAGDVSGGLGICCNDFWQSYPSSLEVSDARSHTANLTLWLWSPESEPMDLRHYDNVAHSLDASYEDVQPGMSTPYGIARTTTLSITPYDRYPGKSGVAVLAKALSDDSRLMPVPEYLHSRKAFGIWSLPDYSNPQRSAIEERLNAYIDIYKKASTQHKWYGFWNWGDVMHAYDPVRHQWMYDVGGYAWDNTELASNMWLWYNFLRTGRQDVWKMAESMTRHTTEVDVYHMGPNAGLGSRHNVSHWGCGAKEARISQAAWNRFYYYLTTDERSGDLMEEVRDAEQKLYTLDPMRLAQPREQYPCTAPARIRIGPDWLAYAGNWLTEWERTGNTSYRDKISAGMNSISSLSDGLFSGPKALGFDPATCVISYEGDSTVRNTNHLATIMGGFEIMNEVMMMIDNPQWNRVWLSHAARYKQMALEVSKSRFRISRLMAYAACHLRDKKMADEAWHDIMTRLEHTRAPEFTVSKVLPPYAPAELDECPTISTNDAALWSLDAIYMLEVIPPGN